MSNPIRMMRLKAKMSQEELADAADVSRSAVAQVERKDPRLTTLLRYASAAGVREITLDLSKDWVECIDVRLKRAKS